MKTGGFVLIAIGLIALAFQFLPITRTETVADIGPLEIKKEERVALPLPPILGIVAVAAGVALVVAASRTKLAT